jgi:diguanylate cyclase (GGDEF)-like protein
MQGSYDTYLVALSILVAIFVSFISLKLAARVASTRGAYSHVWLLGGALTMGSGIWAMHFIGILALELPIRLTYDLSQTLYSLVIAVVISGVALAIASRSRFTGWHLAGGGVLMGFGICAMHYAGMGAIEIVPPISYSIPLVIGSIVIAISASVVALRLAFWLRRRRTWQANLAALGGAVVMGLAISGMHYTGMAASNFAPDAYCIGGIAANSNRWLATTVMLVAVGLLMITSILLFYDAHLQTTRRYARQLQQANARLRHVAMHDTLTGLPNRLLFADRLRYAIGRMRRDELHFAVMMVDLDSFKTVNDSLGHAAGDVLIIETGRRLRSLIRETDTVARFGGDEFVLLLNGIANARDAEIVARKMLEHARRPVRVGDRAVQTHLSVGISLCPEDGTDAETLLRRADKAMYSAKKAGGDTFQLSPPTTTPFPRDPRSREQRRSSGA